MKKLASMQAEINQGYLLAVIYERRNKEEIKNMVKQIEPADYWWELMLPAKD
jgi:hypothetical protein